MLYSLWSHTVRMVFITDTHIDVNFSMTRRDSKHACMPWRGCQYGGVYSTSLLGCWGRCDAQPQLIMLLQSPVAMHLLHQGA